MSNGKMTIDHVQPRSRGGEKRCITNLVPACSPCNDAKADMTLEEYRQDQGCELFYGEKAGPTVLAQ